MTKRIGFAAALLLACASLLHAQQNMFKIKLAASGTMVSMNEPVLIGGMYVFKAWPDGETTNLPQTQVASVTRLTGAAAQTIYQIALVPSGAMTARDKPVLKNGSYVFHEWQAGTIMSVRQSDVKGITPMTGDKAFWVEQGLKGEKRIGNVAMEGASKVTVVGVPPTGGNSSQAGRSNLSSVGGQNGTTINGAPVGNWQYQGTPGSSDAYAPANATVDGGGVPTMPAATNGTAPPTQPQ
jgi:hypothetical protein